MNSCKVSRRSEIAPFYAMEVLREANEKEAAGKDVLHLEVGEPGRGAPPKVIDAAGRLLRDGTQLGYTEALGIRPLRERVAVHYQETYGVDIPVERIAITSGSSAGFMLTLLGAFDPGDRIAIGMPSYPAYRNMIQALGLSIIPINTDANSRFQPTLDQLKEVGAVDGLLIASPSNPTGTMIAKSVLEDLTDYCDGNGIRLLSDEVYHGVTYEGPASTIAGITLQGVVFNGFSKYYCMTGWRLGWLILPEDLLRPVERLAQNVFISSHALSQWAAIAAFDSGDVLDQQIEVYGRNRAHLLKGLTGAGLKDFAPADGAFYLYVDVRDITDDSQNLCSRLLRDTGVAITPGIDFDPEYGSGYVRISFAAAEPEVIEACDRMVGWLSEERKIKKSFYSTSRDV